MPLVSLAPEGDEGPEAYRPNKYGYGTANARKAAAMLYGDEDK